MGQFWCQSMSDVFYLVAGKYSVSFPFFIGKKLVDCLFDYKVLPFNAKPDTDFAKK